MQYLLLIYDQEAEFMKMSKDDYAKMYAEYGAFTADIKAKGNHLGGHELQPIATATTVRIRDGKRLTTDGPFAETKEQLGGFYLIEAKNLDEAIDIASRIPSARRGSIEVRPIVVHGQAAGIIYRPSDNRQIPAYQRDLRPLTDLYPLGSWSDWTLLS